MKTSAPEPNARIDLIDALRGSALAGILLLHSIEHWDFMGGPEQSAAWLRPFNQAAHEAAFFLFSGKAYAVFALLFGVSFCLILDRWSGRGLSFQGRFLWRLGVLAMIGYLHGLIFCGDILLVIAVLGMPLTFLHKFGNRALGWIAVVLLLQLPSIWQVGRIFFETGYQMPQPRHWSIYGQVGNVFAHGSFLDVLKTNLWTGQWTRIWWTIETGRYTQMMGLFVVGLLLGRARIFQDRARSVQLAKRALIWGVLGFAIIYPVRTHLRAWGLRDMPLYATENLVTAYLNLAQAAVWVGVFVLLFQWAKSRAALRLFAPYGRMSLTCYVTQALIGVPLFYNYGFGFYRWAGPFYSVLVGAGILIVQLVVARIWLTYFVYGPLEWVWRAATFGSVATPIRRRPPVSAPIAPVAAVT